MYKLIPLRIPEGWSVVRNDLMEYYPAKKVIRTDDKHLLSGDMLTLLYDTSEHPGNLPNLKVTVGWCSRKGSTGDFLVSFFTGEKMMHLANVHSIASAASQVEEWIALDYIKVYLKAPVEPE